MNDKINLLSIVVPTYNGSGTIVSLIEDLVICFNQHKFEIVVVNDHSPDSTHEKIETILNKYSDKITYIKLSKNFGENNAVIAGLNYCHGDYAIIMDDDYQNPPSEALKLAEYSLSNDYDVVYTNYKVKSDSLIRNLMSKFSNFTARLLIKKPPNIYLSSFKCIKKNIIQEIISFEGPEPNIDGIILSKTNNLGSCNVRHDKRKVGKSNYNLLKLMSHYGNLIINNTTLPIHLFSFLGLILTSISFVLFIITIFEKITNPNVPIGYTTIVILIVFFSGVQFLFLGLIGEYLGRLLRGLKNEKHFIIDYIKKRN